MLPLHWINVSDSTFMIFDCQSRSMMYDFGHPWSHMLDEYMMLVFNNGSCCPFRLCKKCFVVYYTKRYMISGNRASNPEPGDKPLEPFEKEC